MVLIRQAAAMGVDYVELRLDYLKNFNGIEKIVEFSTIPLIATNRQHQQGGHRIQPEDQRVQALIDAAKLGFQYIDIELTTNALHSVIHELKERGAGIIVSFHNFEQTPQISELEKIIRAQAKAGADICKLVTTAKDVADNISCLLLTWKMSRIAKVVCFAMGETGKVSRVLSPIFGGYFTYAAVKEGFETASGQMSISDLNEVYRVLGVEGGHLRKN